MLFEPMYKLCLDFFKNSSTPTTVFNSFLFHRAGFNKTTQKRIGINNIFTTPIIKQQINLPEFLEGKYKKQKKASMLLGYDFPTINSDEEFRELRLKKISK